MLNLDVEILRRMLATIDSMWIDKYDDYLEKYFDDWYGFESFTIEPHEMMYIQEYVSEKGYATKREKSMVNRYISLQAKYYLFNEPDVQEKINSLKCNTGKL